MAPLTKIALALGSLAAVATATTFNESFTEHFEDLNSGTPDTTPGVYNDLYWTNMGTQVQGVDGQQAYDGTHYANFNGYGAATFSTNYTGSCVEGFYLESLAFSCYGLVNGSIPESDRENGYDCAFFLIGYRDGQVILEYNLHKTQTFNTTADGSLIWYMDVETIDGTQVLDQITFQTIAEGDSGENNAYGLFVGAIDVVTYSATVSNDKPGCAYPPES